MPGEVEIRADKSLLALGRDLGLASKDTRKAIVRWLQAATRHVQRHLITKNLSNKFVGRGFVGRSGTGVARRSGRLAQSITRKIDKDDLTGFVGSNLIYLRTLEFGATIRPRKGQWLTIPLPEALTAAGVARFTAGELRASPVRGGFAHTFIRRNDEGVPIIYGVRLIRSKSFEGHELTPLFTLKKSVTIPPKRPMARTVEETTDEILAMLDEELKRGLDKSLTRRV